MYISAKIQLWPFFRIENAVVAEKAAEIYLWRPTAVVQNWIFGCSTITVHFTVGTKLLFIGLQIVNSQRSAALLTKSWPLACKESSCFLVQKVATSLHKKRPLPCTKGSWFIVQKVDDLLHKKRPLFCTEGRRWLLSCTKGGCFLAQKVAPFLYKGLPLPCTKGGHFLVQKVAAPLH